VIVIPAIDLRGGKVVRLRHGDPAAQTIYGDDPVEVARKFAAAGASMIHVVDLDAAFGEGNNREIIRRICTEVDAAVQTGGGLRSLDSMREAFDGGAARAIAGTAAAVDSALMEAAAKEFGDNLVVALDVKGDRVMTKGWKEDSGAFDELASQLTEKGASRFLITQINVDGTMEGPDLGLYRHAMELTDRPIIASGGVRTMDDVTALAGAGVEAAIVGKALYEGTISIEDAVKV
jgi:phosphoribosylformimino-5-aminoimidazole carboxamide ribotide isomerase